jgi:hypothetical protein
VTFVEDRPFFYNPSTQPSYSSTESTSFLGLPLISLDDNIPIPSPTITIIPNSLSHVPPPPPPSHSFSKPPVTHVFRRRPKDPTTLPSTSSTLAGPDELAVDDSNNTNDESPLVHDELQVGPRYNL